MRTIIIDNKEFQTPADCFYVAIDFDGKIYAYEKEPIKGNNVAGCWVTGCHWQRPGMLIGDLGRIVTDWKDSLLLLPKEGEV